MFGIGLEEILLFVLIVFLISPKDIPKVMRKIGAFFNELNRLKNEVMQLKNDVYEIAKEARLTNETLEPNTKAIAKKQNRKNAGKKRKASSAAGTAKRKKSENENSKD